MRQLLHDLDAGDWISLLVGRVGRPMLQIVAQNVHPIGQHGQSLPCIGCRFENHQPLPRANLVHHI